MGARALLAGPRQGQSRQRNLVVCHAAADALTLAGLDDGLHISHSAVRLRLHDMGPVCVQVAGECKSLGASFASALQPA
eukprot:scaffold74605_cov32-Tisochrysis_lutea.AAC.1